MAQLIYRIYKYVNINVLLPWEITGPKLLTSTLLQLDYKACKLYPSHYFIPKHHTGLEYKGTDKIYAKQYWGSTFGYDKIKMPKLTKFE